MPGRGLVAGIRALPLAALLAGLSALGGCNSPTPFDLFTTNLAVASLDDAALAEVNLTRKAVGMLNLPDGKVAVADPLVFPEVKPLSRSVAPGSYPVEVIWSEQDSRVALALMRFSQKPVARWEIAARPGQDVAKLGPAEFFPVNVDAGLAMFASSRFAAAFDRRMALLKKQSKSPNYYDDFLAREMANDVEFLIHFPMPADKTAGAAIIHSGWGDGSYPVLWGLDDDGRPIVLMIDFYVIDDASGIPRDDRPLLEQSLRSLGGLMSRLREAAETAKSNPTPQ